jgi:hypothetical protein
MSVILIHAEIKQENFKCRSLRMKGKSCMSASSRHLGALTAIDISLLATWECRTSDVRFPRPLMPLP